MAYGATKERAHELIERMEPETVPVVVDYLERIVISREQAGKRILGAGTALTHLPSEEELERIDREWKQEIDEKRIGCSAE